MVIVGSGAGGGTLANELCQKGIDVVLLEAGKRASIDTFVNDEWPSFLQLAWLDKRTTSGTWRVARDFPNLPAWTCKTVGGTTTHWAGASLRLQEHEFLAAPTYGDIAGANLLDWPITLAELEPYYAKAEDKMGVTRTNGIPGLPGNNNFKVCTPAPSASGTRRSTPATWRSTASRAPTGRPASRSASASRAARSAAKWSTLYTEIPAARRPASSSCGPSAMALQIQHDDCRQGHGRRSTPTRTATSTSRRRASSASPATRSRARGCC